MSYAKVWIGLQPSTITHNHPKKSSTTICKHLQPSITIYNHPQLPKNYPKKPKLLIYSCFPALEKLIIKQMLTLTVVSDNGIYTCVRWYCKTRVTSYKLRVESIKSTSWNWKMQVQIHELRVQIHDLRVQIHELRVHIHELRVRIHELQVQFHELRVRIHEFKNHY